MTNAPMHQGPYAQPHDPYRAQAPAPRFAAIKATTRVVFAAIVSVMMLAFGTAVTAWTIALVTAETRHGYRQEPDGTLMGIGAVGLVMLVILLYAQIAAGLVWVHKAWSWLPWDQRYTRHWRGWITPGQASLMLLIPYFHYYWMFVSNIGLCDALDRLRVSYPTTHAAPKSLAIAACVCQLVVPFPVASILWFIFMSRIERMTREMSVSMEPRLGSAF